jgi:hypothetical protein
MHRSADSAVRDTKFQLVESERQRARLEDELKAYEEQVQNLRQAMDDMVCVSYVCCIPDCLFNLSHCLDSKQRKVIFSLRNAGRSAKLQT